MFISKRIALLGAGLLAVAGVAGGSTYALASSNTTSTPAAVSAAAKLPPGFYSDGHFVQCGNATSMRPHTGAESAACPAVVPNKYTTTITGAPGPRGAVGPVGATGAVGPAGPVGPAGRDGQSAAQSVSASTSITNWPESGLWADDSMIRGVTVTREGAADVDHCSGAPKCWLYTFVLTDGSGHFVTRDGAATPNGTGGTIHGSFTGDFSGVAVGQFYADTDQLTGSIPATATGAAKPASTTNWATLALAGSGHAYGTKLTQYGWTYVNPPALCGQWVDKINPGDDGQSAADGNVTGTSVC